MATNSVPPRAGCPAPGRLRLLLLRTVTPSTIALFVVLTAAAIPRLLNFQGRYEIRDGDEISYMTGGLQLWEGLPPGMEHTPAGPQTWLSWTYALLRSGYYYFFPDARWQDQTWKTRSFLAIDTALFKTYEDLSPLHHFLLGVQLAISLGGVYAGFRLGYARGGLFTAIILGGITGMLPLFVEYVAMTRPYSDAWSFGLMALASAVVSTGGRRVFLTGLFLGFAIASRIEMLMLFPLVVWELLYRRAASSFWGELTRVTGVTAVVTLLLAPWLMTALVHNLRQIATVRVMGQFSHPSPRLQTLHDLILGEGLGIFILVSGVGMFLVRDEARWKRVALAVILGLLLASMFTGPFQPMRYHAIAILTLIFTGALGLGGMLSRWPRLGVPLAALILFMPGFQCYRMVVNTSGTIPVKATDWIEEKVTPGTVVYLMPADHLRVPLPTEKASEAIWKEVTDERAWRRKFARGLSRFDLSLDYTPRCLSEVNLTISQSSILR